MAVAAGGLVKIHTRTSPQGKSGKKGKTVTVLELKSVAGTGNRAVEITKFSFLINLIFDFSLSHSKPSFTSTFISKHYSLFCDIRRDAVVS